MDRPHWYDRLSWLRYCPGVEGASPSSQGRTVRTDGWRSCSDHHFHDPFGVRMDHDGLSNALHAGDRSRPYDRNSGRSVARGAKGASRGQGSRDFGRTDCSAGPSMTVQSPSPGLTRIRHERIPILDGWRAVSILAVLGAHLLPIGPKWLHLNDEAGAFGMALFFTLSGFLIVSFLDAGMPVKTFLLKRCARVVPLSWAAMIF